MAEYIEREEAIKSAVGAMHGVSQIVAVDVVEALEGVQAADVAKVRHGEWVITKKILHSDNPYLDDDYYLRVECSECGLCVQETRGGYGYPTPITTSYCPDCGAKMDGKGDDG